MFLIVKLTPLADQYECDYDRQPVRVVPQWQTDDLPDGCEVYEIHSDGSLTCIKRYENFLERGMWLYCLKGEKANTTILKFVNLTRDDPIPKEVIDFASENNLKCNDKFLVSSGHASFKNKANEYTYEEYTRG